MRIAHRIARQIERVITWLGLRSREAEDVYADSLIAPYDARTWPTCTPRIGETYGRYRERARRSRERSLLEEVWRVTAAPDRDGVWKTNVDQITRKRDGLLQGDGFAS